MLLPYKITTIFATEPHISVVAFPRNRDIILTKENAEET